MSHGPLDQKKDRNLIEGVQNRAIKLVPEIKDLEYEEKTEKDGLTKFKI